MLLTMIMQMILSEYFKIVHYKFRQNNNPAPAANNRNVRNQPNPHYRRYEGGGERVGGEAAGRLGGEVSREEARQNLLRRANQGNVNQDNINQPIVNQPIVDQQPISQPIVNQRNIPEHSHNEDNQYYTIACKRNDNYNYTLIQFVSNKILCLI